MVDHIYILRKTPLQINENKITCLCLPWILRKRPIYWFLTSWYGVSLMRKYETNIILSYNIFPHGFNAYLASKITKQRAIFSEINEDTIRYYRWFIFHSLIKKILHNASLICTPGENTASFWNKSGFSKTYQLHSTIDTTKFKPDTTQRKIYDFIYIGTLDKNKRPSLILEAFHEVHKSLSNVTLCIIGFGNLENDLKKQIVNLNLGDCVSLVKTNNVLEYLQRSKIFVMASLSEGLPCAMMEAMSSGLIVIVPSVGDISNVIDNDKNGYLYDNSKHQLIFYMNKAINNLDNLEEMKIRARNTIINEHSYQVATYKWDIVLKNLCHLG